MIWKGVLTAMGMLLGARGGVKASIENRKNGYEHLSRHYAQFDKEPPELREYVQGELKQMFPELYDIKEATKPTASVVRVIDKFIHVVEEDKKFRTVEEIAAKQVKDAFDGLRGKV